MHTNIRIKNHTFMHASEPRSSIIDMCIIHTCIRVKDRGKLKNASYMHVSGSRVMDKCIIGRCIIVTCIRIKKICIAHAYKHQESYIHACFRTKVQYHRYVHHTHMHQSQGLRNIDKCITHTCIRTRVKDRKHRFMHHACMYQD